MGLPVGRDMNGRPLLDAFESEIAVDLIDSWDLLPGNAGMHPPDRVEDTIEAAEAIEQLVALGYIERPDKDVEKAIRNTVRELKYNEARAFMDAGMYGSASGILEGLVEEYPHEYRFAIQFINCLKAVGKIREAREALDRMMGAKMAKA